MKTFIRIFLVCLVLLLVVLTASYFLVINAGFQKRVLIGQLPEGSSIKRVHVTADSLQLAELIVALPDGTRIKVAEVDTSFSPLSALFDQTIKIGALQVEGVVVQLPAISDRSKGGSTASIPVNRSSEHNSTKAVSPAVETATKPWEVINTIGNLEWLLDVEQIKLSGQLIDGNGRTYALDLQSGAISPSAVTVVEASLQLISNEPIFSGLKEFDSNSSLRFSQKKTGGFEQVKFEFSTIGKDTDGAEVLAVSNHLDLAFNGFEETADLTVDFRVSVLRPEIFMPELVKIGALNLTGTVAGNVSGTVMTLSKANAKLAANGTEVLALDLKKPLNLGGKQNLSGELLALKLTQLPFEWIGPWLPEAMSIQSTPLSAQFSVTGLSDGAVELRALSPLRIGPITARNLEQTILQETTIEIDPVVRVNAGQSVVYEVKQFRLLDRYGEVLSGQVSGRFVKPVAGVSDPFSGQTVNVKLKAGLQEVFQQSLLKGKASILGGTVNLTLKVDGASDFPLSLQGVIEGLRTSSLPGQAEDYRFATQLKNISPDIWGLGLNFESGSTDRPSTSLQVSAQADLDASPLTFKADLTSSQLSTADFDVLIAAFTPKALAPAPTPRPVLRAPAALTSPANNPAVMSNSVPPAWAAVKGEVSVNVQVVRLKSGQVIRNVTAKALVSEPLLRLSDLSAKLGDGILSGSGEIRYAAREANAYSLLAAFGFKEIDPSFFSKKRSGSFPIQGLFDGVFNLTGSGSTLDEAVDSSVGDFKITGTNGVLTAFELDNRSQLGLGVMGLLGKQFDRPGISAIAETVPYFKDIRFDSFVLELKRGADQKVMIPQLKFIGESLLIDGYGMIAASNIQDIMDQPLQLGLELGAKGKLVHYLETLQLLKPVVAEDGFRRWNKAANIKGTLGDPDTSEIMDILSSAAKSALSKPQSPEPATVEGPTTTPVEAETQPLREKTKSEKRLDEIGMGLDLLNTILGN